MQMNLLGSTDIQVSELTLGTMTYGTQTTTEDAHRQMDMAVEAGINMFDTAEMYPVNPISAEKQGDSERNVGTWLAKSNKRDRVMIATKVSGAGMRHVRDGAPISRATLIEAVENSLQRLQVEHIDLHQLHWPNRGSYMFRQNWTYDPTSQSKAETHAHMEEVLEAIQDMTAAGKIGHFGLSNESAWGTAQWLRLSEDMGLPRVQTIQNEYSLMCRLYDTDLAELSHNEDVGLLAFSPLAAGLLTGKYQSCDVPENSRKSYVANLGGRVTDRTAPAVDAYINVAQKHGLHPVHMALAWCRTRPFVVSAIMGATTSKQLEIILGTPDVVLSQECLDDLAAAHKAHPMPY